MDIATHILHSALQCIQLVNDTIGISVASAQNAPTATGFTPISDGFNKLIGATGGNFGVETDSFGTFINSIYKLSIRIAGAVAVAMFVWGGILYMVAPFGVAGEGISEAKARMKNAVLGLLMLLATWIIFNQINPDILNLKISAQPLAPLTAPTQNASPTSTQVPVVDNTGGADVQVTQP